ncbi:hypothetical protein GLYMA_15G139300v4 [Glycine max]|nr:hypothetical protein GLYMA_15G139300v4 [Glycine max]KAH1147081.1 hypothetical protein GYH30_042312 [Glycine max]
MKEHQTSHKVFARSTENRHGRFKDFPSKKSNKITDKSLNAAFASLSEDSVDLSPISEISFANHNEDVTNFLLEEPSSVTLVPSDLSPKKITDATEIIGNVKAPQFRRELMDGIIEYVISDLQTYTLPEERDQFAHLLSMKSRMLFLCTFIWVIGVSVLLFFTLDARGPYRGPTPT